MSKLLLISNSTNYGEEYLGHPRVEIAKFLGSDIKKVLFIPFAAVSFSYDAYLEKVGKVFNELGYEVESIHKAAEPISAIMNAEAIIVGGGNTFHLLHVLQTSGMMQPIFERVHSGTPYIGWSAGANLACPTIKTTNDMPVIEPESFEALNLVPFQINPHYTDAMPENHGGETREQRILEFLEVNKDIYVVGLKEGTMLLVEGSRTKLVGKKPMRLFKYGKPILEHESSANLDFLMSEVL